MKRILYTLICLLVLVNHVEATDYYVCKLDTDCNAGAGSGWSTGSDDNNGTAKATPYETIQKCETVMSAGDTCTVGDGTYTDTTTHTGDNNEFNLYITGLNGSEGNEIIFQAENKWGATIEAVPEKEAGGSVAVRFAGVSPSSWVIIDGFEVKNAYWTGIGVNEGNHDIIIKNCWVHHIGRHEPTASDYLYGIVAFGSEGTSYNITWDSNLVHDIGRLHTGPYTDHYYKHDHGNYCQGWNQTIINNIFYNIYSGFHISVRGYDGSPQEGRSHIISNNVFAYAANPFVDYYGGVINTYHYGQDNACQDILIQNNIVYEPSDNTFLKTKSSGNYHCDGTDNIIRNNVGDWSDIVYNYDAGFQTIENNTVISNSALDTQMTDLDNQDFTLTHLASDLIDSGHATLTPDHDFLNNARPKDCGSATDDIGAYEYQGATPTVSGVYPLPLPIVVACTEDPRDVTIGWVTPVTANCRIKDVDEGDYASMPADSVDNTDSISHSDVENLACGQAIIRYVYCEDPCGNEVTGETTIPFTITADIPPPVIGEASETGFAGAGWGWN